MAKAVKKKPTEEKPEAKEPKLTDKQRIFCLEYAACLNATHAAKKAGYSEDTAYSQGQRLLKNVEIRAEVDRHLTERVMPAVEVLERFGQQARSEQANFYRSDFGESVYIDLKGLVDAGLGHLIKSITRDAMTRSITKVEFYDAQSALEKLGRHHKLFTDKVEHSGNLNERRADDLTDDELAIVIQSRKH